MLHTGPLKSLKQNFFCPKYPSMFLSHLSIHQSHTYASEGFVFNRKEQLCTILLCAETLSVSCYEVIFGCSYLWPWSLRGPRPAAGLRGRCIAAVRRPRQWWTPESHGFQNMALWDETRHSHCHGNCACSAGTRGPQTVAGIGILGRRGGEKKTKLNEFMNTICIFFFCLQKNENTILILTPTPLPRPLALLCSFNHFFFFPLPSPSLVVFPPQTALPFGYFSLTPSVSLMQMFSLVTKPRGEFTAWLGSSTLRIATHPSTHLFLCFLSKFSLSPPSSLGFWILNHFHPLFFFLLLSAHGVWHVSCMKHMFCCRD